MHYYDPEDFAPSPLFVASCPYEDCREQFEGKVKAKVRIMRDRHKRYCNHQDLILLHIKLEKKRACQRNYMQKMKITLYHPMITNEEYKAQIDRAKFARKTTKKDRKYQLDEIVPILAAKYVGSKLYVCPQYRLEWTIAEHVSQKCVKEFMNAHVVEKNGEITIVDKDVMMRECIGWNDK